MSDGRPAFLPTSADEAAPGGRPSFLPTSDAEPVAEESEEEAPKTGLIESGLRGVKQGITFGFGDEITGALESAFSDKTYKQARDEARANDAKAQHDNYWGYNIGEILGGVAAPIPGVGALAGAAKGASLGVRFAVNAAKGAGAGILSGAGNSEATDIGGIAHDAATSGLAGAALGGILGTGMERLTHGAEGREGKSIIQAITGGRATAAGKNVYRNEELVLDTARKFKINPNGADPEALATVGKSTGKQIGKAIGESYAVVDGEHSGALTRDIIDAAKAIKGKYGAPSQKAMRQKIDSYVEDLADRWGKGETGKAAEGAVAADVVTAKGIQRKVFPGTSAKSADRVSLADLNREVGELEKVGFAGADLAPSAAKQLKRDMADALNGVLDKRMGEISESSRNIAASPMGAHPALEGATGAADVLGKLKELNRDYRGLKLITRAAEDRTGMPDANRAAGGLRDIAGKGGKAIAIAASLASGNPLPVLASHVGIPLAIKGNKVATAALAKLARSSRAGNVTAKMAQEALSAGVPKSIVDKWAPGVASLFSDRDETEATE